MFYVQKQNKQANRKKSPNDRCKKKKKDRRQGHRGCVSEVKTRRISHPDWPLLKNKQSARCWMSRLNQHHWLLRGGKQRESLDVAAETSQTQGRNMVIWFASTRAHTHTEVTTRGMHSDTHWCSTSTPMLWNIIYPDSWPLENYIFSDVWAVLRVSAASLFCISLKKKRPILQK